MEFRHCHATLWLALVYAIAQVLGSTLTCPNNIRTEEKVCGETCFHTDFEKKSENIYEEILDSYLGQNQVKFVKNVCGNFDWQYSNEIVEARHIILTVYAVDNTPPDSLFYPSDGVTEYNNTDVNITQPPRRFLPLRGCCGIPLTANTCKTKVTLLFDTELFFSLTLFRVSSFAQLNVSHDCTMFPVAAQPEQLVPTDPLGTDPTSHRNWGTVVKPFQKDLPTKVTVFEKYVRKLEAKKYDSVCVFNMPEDEVMGNNTDASPYNVDSELFNRGVFHMSGYLYQRDRIFHLSQPNKTVECDTQRYDSGNDSADSVYNMSSANPDNSTFTCMVLWSTVNASDHVVVKCMPHNETYLHVPVRGTDEKYVRNWTLIIVVSSVGSTILVAVVILIMWRWKKKYSKMLKDSRKVPVQLDDILKDDVGDLSACKYDLCGTEKVDVMDLGKYKMKACYYYTNHKDPLENKENLKQKKTSLRTQSIDNPTYDSSVSNPEYLQKSTNFEKSPSSSYNDHKQVGTQKESLKTFHDSGLGNDSNVTSDLSAKGALQHDVKISVYSIHDAAVDSDLESNYMQKSTNAVPAYFDKSCDSGVGTSGGSFNFSSSSGDPVSVKSGVTEYPQPSTTFSARFISNDLQSLEDSLKKKEDSTSSKSKLKGNDNCPISGCSLFSYPIDKDKCSKVSSTPVGDLQPGSPPLTGVSCTDSGYPDSPSTYHGESSESDEEMIYAETKVKIEATTPGSYVDKDTLVCEPIFDHKVMAASESTVCEADGHKGCRVHDDNTDECAVSPYVEKNAFIANTRCETNCARGKIQEDPPSVTESFTYDIEAPYLDKCVPRDKICPAQASGQSVPEELSGEDNCFSPYLDKTTLKTNVVEYMMQTDTKLGSEEAEEIQLTSSGATKSLNKSKGVTETYYPGGSPYLDKRTLLPICERQQAISQNSPYLDKHTLQPIENICRAQQGQGIIAKPEVT